ncbi:MAG: hypothetical protein JWN04_1198 [Myxococcaceae bacterium]|nr:hypothetical protein [Myxococcaceae bacterium]
MRIDLGQLSAADLQLDIPASSASHGERALTVSNAEQLRGVLETSASGWQLDDLTAVRLLLAKLHWQLGSVTLVSEEDAALQQLKASVASKHGDTVIALELGQLDAERLQVATASVRLAAQVEARGLRLESRQGVGLLTAEQATLHAFELQVGALTLSIPELKLTQLLLDWSGEDFRLEVGTAAASALSVAREGTKLEGSGVTLAALRLLGSKVRVGQLRAGRFDVTVELAPQPAQPGVAAHQLRAGGPTPLEHSAPTLDYTLLDGLVGRLDVDVALDVAVPVIGHRRATHELRVPIDQGALNYRELEHNLARLEDSLLDFAVREEGLVLEWGLPLITTRGRGKPILIWDLSPADRVLAEQQRVRLAVLPTFRLAGAGQSEPPREESTGTGGVKLRHLSFENIDAALRLLQSPTGASGALRDLTFANLTVRGTVHHDPEGPPRSGRLDFALEGLRASLGALELGNQTLKGRIELAALREAQIDFADVRPVRAKAIVEGVALADLELAG